MADGADLAHFVGQRQQGGGTGEKLPHEIHPQAIGHDRCVQVVHRAGQLPDLCVGQELRLVDQHAGDGALGQTRLDHGEQVAAFLEGVRVGTDADTRADAALSGAAVEAGGQQVGIHPALFVVMRGLQQDRAFARVHGGIVEVELGHVMRREWSVSEGRSRRSNRHRRNRSHPVRHPRYRRNAWRR